MQHVAHRRSDEVNRLSTENERRPVVLDQLDGDCLYAAEREEEYGRGAWRPWHGMFARARRLARNGLLKEAGISAMPPHKVYVITDFGREELALLMKLSDSSTMAKPPKTNSPLPRKSKENPRCRDLKSRLR